MPFRVVNLPGPITLIPGRTLDGQVRRQARDHPDLPVDLRQLMAGLRARTDGVPATFSEPRNGGDWSLLIYAQTYAARLFLTKKYKDAYTIAAINPLRIHDHHRLAQGCLLLRPAGWQMVYDIKQIPPRSHAYWSRLVAEWEQLTAGLAAQRGAPLLTTPQTAFLDTLDRLINATEKITTDEGRSIRAFPYRDVMSTGERRYGTHSIYEFQLAGGRNPEQGAFVQVRGEPGQRGQVTRVVGKSVTVRFDQPVDWAHIARQGELEVTPSSVVFNKQREAVALLRTRQAHNLTLLSVVVDHQVRRIRLSSAEPTEDLDGDQLDAFRKAVAVQDMLLVLGPPGTGKTRTISQIARACAVAGERVLLTSHTNRAVDTVLARLPRDLLAIRVGNEGSVTAEGQPYLLERQAADLRTEIINVTKRSMTAYEGLRVTAPRWAEELDNRVDKLSAALDEQARARAELDAARRAVGGAAQTRVDKLATEHEKRQQARIRNQNRIERLTRRHDRAQSLTGWLLLGALFSALARLWDRHLATERENGEHLRDAEEHVRGELVQAQRELDAATRDDPAVRAARTAWDDTTRHRDECRAAALTAAHASRAALSAVDTPPSIRDEGEPGTTERDVADLRTWLNERLPVLTVRAKLLDDWHGEVSGATDQLYPELIRYAHVIAATCIGTSSRPELSDVDFDLTIVDEAGQIGTPDVLVPLVRARRAVLVGDHKQLPPFLDSEVEAWGANVEDPLIRGLLAKSALELLVDKLPNTHIVPLTWQRRMPSAIADFISASFYDNKLRTDVQREHQDLLFRSPIAFVDTAQLPAEQRYEKSGRERERWGQPGYTNPAEAELLTGLAAFYHRLGVEWAVIVPYRAQVAEITAALTDLVGDATMVELNVGTVDAFQGGERDVVLYGFTRSNRDGHVGFLKELRRANVAFTRAKYQLVLVGDMTTLTRARDQGFCELARLLRDHLTDRGDLRHYREIHDQLAKLSAGR